MAVQRSSRDRAAVARRQRTAYEARLLAGGDDQLAQTIVDLFRRFAAPDRNPRSNRLGGEPRDCAIASPVAASTPSRVAKDVSVLRQDVRRSLAVLERLAPECRESARMDLGDDGVFDLRELCASG